MDLLPLYKKLLYHFGPQGWWPTNNNFRPKFWEICVGAILTQNTAWTAVQKALTNFVLSNCTTPKSILFLKKKELEKIVRPAGFYTQKAERLRTFSKFVLSFGNFKKFLKSVKRDELLKLPGIGPETADCILLYACNRAVFVIDKYTKRFYSRYFGKNISNYNKLQKIFQKSLPKDVKIYKEFHALIVALAKHYCKKVPICSRCPLFNCKSQKCSYTTKS
jgi:endonuclease-3 related protein